MRPIILIPAYRPDGEILKRIIRQISCFDVDHIIVVDDGNGPEFEPLFDQIKELKKTWVLHHPENKGKGSALRTGFRHILRSIPGFSCVVTVDAGGQHLPRDVKKIIDAVLNHEESIILGVRDFKGKVPLRSYIGNKLTYLMFRGVTGRKITDTQTGLRAIPRTILEELVGLSSRRYAYELEMLLTLVHRRIPIVEVPITTVYEDNSAMSSFRPVSDSISVYTTLFRWWISFKLFQILKYSLSSIFSTITDFGAYILLIHFSFGIGPASILARGLSVMIHFSANKYFTFSVKNLPDVKEIGKYLLVVGLNLSLSIGFIHLLVRYLPVGEVTAKVMAQLFLFTYALLNGFVFLKEKQD